MKSCFEFAVPWFKEYSPRVIKRFELIKIPLHFWNKEVFRKIGSNLGKVKKVHYKNYYFLSVKDSEVMDLIGVMHRNLNLVKIRDDKNGFNIIVKEIGPILFDDGIIIASEST